MLSVGEIARGTQGALKFLRRDRTAAYHFDNSPEACLRSFRVMAVVAPLYVIYLLLFYSRIHVEADLTEVVYAEVLRYVVDWLLYPVIFYEVARRRGWLDRYSRYIGALNWINLPGVTFALFGMVASTVLPQQIEPMIELGLRALFFYWFLVVTHMMLGIGWGLSMLLLILNWVPSLMLSIIVTRFLGLAPIPGS